MTHLELIDRIKEFVLKHDGKPLSRFYEKQLEELILQTESLPWPLTVDDVGEEMYCGGRFRIPCRRVGLPSLIVFSTPAWLDAMEEMRDRLEQQQPPPPAPTPPAEPPKVKKRRRTSPRKAVPLTPKQTEAMQLVAEHKGDFSAAGKAAGKSRQAMQKLYGKASKKLGKEATKTVHKTQAIPKDRRGQETLTDDRDD